MVERIHGQDHVNKNNPKSGRTDPSRKLLEGAELIDGEAQEIFENRAFAVTTSLKGRASKTHKNANKSARAFDRQIRLHKTYLTHVADVLP